MMVFNFSVQDREFSYDSDRFSDLSISLNFNGQQPNPFKVQKAASKPYRKGELIGDTRLGGSCNFEMIQIIPHCHGTHTECVGHISDQRMHIHEQLKQVMLPATLISVEPLLVKDQQGAMISLAQLKKGLSKAEPGFKSAVIIRTWPNEPEGKWNFRDNPVPYLSKEAISFLNEQKVEHLLVDFPSIDPLNDEGKLLAHREFWNIEQGSHLISADSNVNKTITEMIFVPNELEDAPYLLNLQIAPFASDASPSRPIVFPLIQKQ